MQERERQLRGVCDTTQSFAKCVAGLVHLVGTEVRQFATFDVAPNPFGGIQVRSVGREPLDLQPTALIAYELLHHSTAVRRQPIPNEDHLVAVHEAAEFFQKLNQTFAVKAVRLRPRQ